MKLATNLGVLISLIFVKSLTHNQCSQLSLFTADQLILLRYRIWSLLYMGVENVFYFQPAKIILKVFPPINTKYLRILDYKRNIDDHVNGVQNGYVRNTLASNLDRIHLFIESHIHDVLEDTLWRHSENEKQHITDCLNGDSFFNLTTIKIPEKTPQYMQKGGNKILYVRPD